MADADANEYGIADEEDAAITAAAMSDSDAHPMTDGEWEAITSLVTRGVPWPPSESVTCKVATQVELEPDLFVALDIATHGDWTNGLNDIVREWLTWQPAPEGPPSEPMYTEADELTREEWDTLMLHRQVHTLATFMTMRGTPLAADHPGRHHLVVGVYFDPPHFLAMERRIPAWRHGVNTILREWLARQQPSTPPVTAAA